MMPSDPIQAMEFAQSKGQARKEGMTGVLFSDVAGLDSTKEELKEVVKACAVWLCLTLRRVPMSCGSLYCASAAVCGCWAVASHQPIQDPKLILPIAMACVC
jgi:hypothetical protein